MHRAAGLQCAQSPQRQEAIEGRAGEPEAVGPPVKLLVQVRAGRHQRSAHHIAVAVDVFGGRVQDDIGTETERLLETGERKVLSTTTSAPAALPSIATAS